MKFSLVAHYFDKIEHAQKRLEMTSLLAELLQQANAQESALICYLSLGLLHPPYIGTQFNIARKLMQDILVEFLDLDAQQVKDAVIQLGDEGSVVAQQTWVQQGDLTLQQVYDKLSEFEKVSGTGSQEKKAKLLQQLLRALCPQEAKYVVRIVLGRLRLGFSDMTILDALSWMQTGDKSLRKDLERAYNVSADIGLIARRLKDGGMDAINNTHITVGIPIRPAAAERMKTAQDIIDKLGHCVAQPKLDGFRLQIHVDNSNGKHKVRFFSRNLQDMSHMFPDVKKLCDNLNISSLVCEGEAICYDVNTGNYLPFQETIKRKRKHDVEQAAQDMPLKVVLFDVLYLNGQELLTATHKERRQALLDLIRDQSDEHIHVIEERKINTVQELSDYFIANIAAGLEGLVVKRENARYQPGKRNFNWIKLKRQEEGHLDDTIDCVILGYYAGRGKRAKFGIGALLVGLYNKQHDRFETVAKIGTGLKDNEWIAIKKQCDDISISEQPHNVISAKELHPDVWVLPEIICIIRADEITMSPMHSAGKTKEKLGYALRFPRFMGSRNDKSATDATTVDEIKKMYQLQFEL